MNICYRPILRFLLLFSLIAPAILFQSSCASRASPDGGPRDTLAPVLDTSFPANGSVYFKAKKIELRFNEYLTLKDANSQIRISPLQNEKPDIKLNKKTIFIELKDSLKESTTYIISFGKALTDFTEGNVNEGFKYVFSTGSYIDSLKLKGTIVDARTGTGVKDLFVALYDSTIYKRDSVAYNKLPDYYAYTNESGAFEITNIKGGAYGLIAFEDQRQDFKLNSGLENMAFLDTLVYIDKNISGLKLKAFKPTGVQRFVGARQQTNNMVLFGFNRPVTDFKIDVTNNPNDSVNRFVFDKNNDTISYYFANKPDSLVFIWSEGILGRDTTVIKLRNMRAAPVDIKLRDKDIRAGDTIIFESKAPVKIGATQYYILDGKDTIKETYVNTAPFAYQYNFFYKPKSKNFKLILPEGFFTNFSGSKNDSIGYDINFLKPEDLGTLEFVVTIEGDTTSSYILQLLEEAGNNLLVEKPFVQATKVNLSNVKPRKLKARLIKDIDKNGEWTTGNLPLGRQPEPILIYNETVEMRANWDMEMEWIVTPQ